MAAELSEQKALVQQHRASCETTNLTTKPAHDPDNDPDPDQVYVDRQLLERQRSLRNLLADAGSRHEFMVGSWP